MLHRHGSSIPRPENWQEIERERFSIYTVTVWNDVLINSIKLDINSVSVNWVNFYFAIHLFVYFYWKVQLNYSVVLMSAIQQSDSVIHIYSVSYSFPLWFTTCFHVLYSRTMSFIHPIDKSLHLLILNSQAIPPHSHGNKSVLCVCFCSLDWLCHILFCVFFILFYFNWRIITLQYCDGFCHPSAWISHRYTYVLVLLNLIF